MTIAYRQLMKNFVFLLTNETSIIDEDIQQIFQLEKKLAQVDSSTH